MIPVFMDCLFKMRGGYIELIIFKKLCSNYSLKLCILFFTPSALQIYRPIRQFFYNIIHPEFSPVRDVYALMFLVDAINFIITIFGYGAFGVSTNAPLLSFLIS